VMYTDRRLWEDYHSRKMATNPGRMKRRLRPLQKMT
jgi:hypothetical protein